MGLGAQSPVPHVRAVTTRAPEVNQDSRAARREPNAANPTARQVAMRAGAYWYLATTLAQDDFPLRQLGLMAGAGPEGSKITCINPNGELPGA
jgi:hypothetical protein